MRPNLILLGAPGSGKGTQAEIIASKLGYKHLSTGNLLRKEIGDDSKLGQKVKSILDAGNLVDDNTVLELIEANSDLNNQSYIFDGFPRNLDQAKLLDDVILKQAKSLAIYFDIDLVKVVNRLVSRRMCKTCGAIFNVLTKKTEKENKCDCCSGELYQRKDDNEETVKNRLDIFKKMTTSVLEYYEKKEILHRVDADKSPELVFEKIKEIIESN